MKHKFNIRTVVACKSAPNGESGLYYCVISCTQKDYANGVHEKMAKNAARKEGFHGTMIVFTEMEVDGLRLVRLFDWQGAPEVPE